MNAKDKIRRDLQQALNNISAKYPNHVIICDFKVEYEPTILN